MNGLQIIENIRHTRTVEDWSAVRSPGRARRRRAKHKQRIVIREVPADPIRFGNTIVMHPATAIKFRAEMKRRAVLA